MTDRQLHKLPLWADELLGHGGVLCDAPALVSSDGDSKQIIHACLQGPDISWESQAASSEMSHSGIHPASHSGLLLLLLQWPSSPISHRHGIGHPTGCFRTQRLKGVGVPTLFEPRQLSQDTCSSTLPWLITESCVHTMILHF